MRKAVCFTAVVLSLALLYFLSLPPGAVALEPRRDGPQDESARAGAHSRSASPTTDPPLYTLVPKDDIRVGMDIYAGMYKEKDYQDYQELKKWVEKVSNADMGYIRLIMQANSWGGDSSWYNGTQVKPERSIFAHDGTNYGLMNVNYTGDRWGEFEDGVVEATNRDVLIQVDLMDDCYYDEDRFILSEYFGTEYALTAPNNSYKLPKIPTNPNENMVAWYRDTVTYNLLRKYNSAVTSYNGKGNDDYDSGYANKITMMFGAVAAELDGTQHILGDGNEITEDVGTNVANFDLSKAILRSSYVSLYTTYKAIGHEKLDDDPLPDWINNPNISPDIKYLCLHGVTHTNYGDRYDKVKDKMGSHQTVFLSTDGVRLSLSQLRQLYYNLITEEEDSSGKTIRSSPIFAVNSVLG